MISSKPDIRDLSLEELSSYFETIGEKPFRATQVFEWIYQKNAWGFDVMANVPKELRERLKQDFVLKSNTIAEKKISSSSRI